MKKSSPPIAIGRLLRSATVGFSFGCSVPEPEVPLFGDFVKAPAQGGQSEVIGLIDNILIEDDPFVRQKPTFKTSAGTGRCRSRSVYLQSDTTATARFSTGYHPSLPLLWTIFTAALQPKLSLSLAHTTISI